MSWGNQIFGVMAACLIGAANPAAVDATDVDVKVSLQDAIRQGSVEVNVTHLGGSTGDNVRVSVRRRGQRAVEVDVAAGTVLRSSTVRYQHIACGKIKGEFTQGLKYRPGSTMVLVDTDWHHFLLEGYCLDYHKKAPPRGQGYAMALHDHRAARILNAAPVIKASPWAFQLALWMDREGLPAAEIQRRFPGKITEVDVSVAQTLLRDAEQSGKKQIPQDMAPDVQQQVEKLFATDPQVRDAAVKVLVGMGGRAAAAMPYVAVNVVTQQNPGEWALGALPPIPTTPAEAAELLERVGVPGLQPWIDKLNRLIEAGGAWDTVPIPPLPAIPGGIGTRALGEAHILRLRTRLPRVRERAARALADFKSPRAIQALLEALADPAKEVREAASDSLRKVTGEQFGTDQAKWQDWWQKNKAEWRMTDDE